MISVSELAALQSFDSRGGITVSVYLPLEPPQAYHSAYDEFMRQIQSRLAECQPQPQCREAVKEDMEIIGLYLRTNGHRQHAGLAIFSCASELFWRAYPLRKPVPTRVSVGPKFDIAPLMQAVHCTSAPMFGT